MESSNTPRVPQCSPWVGHFGGFHVLNPLWGLDKGVIH